jgi:hypothetical protein
MQVTLDLRIFLASRLLVNVKNDCNVVAVKMHTPVFKMMPKISKARTIGKSSLNVI